MVAPTIFAVNFVIQLKYISIIKIKYYSYIYNMKKSNFINNIIVLMFSQVIIKVTGFIYKIYLTNKQGFGDTGNAIYSAGFQVYAILLTLSSIGIPNAISKMVSSKFAIGDYKGAYRILKIAVMLFSFIGFVASIFLYVFSKPISNNLLQIPESELSLQLLAPSIFLVPVASVFRGYFNGAGNIKITAKSQNLEQISKTIITIIIVEVIAIISDFNTTFMAAAATAGTTIATIFSTVYLYILYKKNKKNIWGTIRNNNFNNEKCSLIIKNILLVTIPISFSAFLSVATKSVDSLTIIRILKTYMKTEEAKRLYGILSGKIDTLVILPLSFNIALSTTLVPTIASLIAKGKKKEANNKIRLSLLISLLIGLPCTAIMIIYSEEILNILFPNAMEGAYMLQISSIEIIPLVLIQTVNGALQGIGRAKECVKALLIGLIIKIILNIFLLSVKKIGIYGAIISSNICHWVTLIICLVKLNKESNLFSKIKIDIIKVVFATSAMSLISYLCYTNILRFLNFQAALVIATITGILIYFMLIIILKLFPKDIILPKTYGEKLLKKSRT